MSRSHTSIEPIFLELHDFETTGQSFAVFLVILRPWLGQKARLSILALEYFPVRVIRRLDHKTDDLRIKVRLAFESIQMTIT